MGLFQWRRWRMMPRHSAAENLGGSLVPETGAVQSLAPRPVRSALSHNEIQTTNGQWIALAYPLWGELAWNVSPLATIERRIETREVFFKQVAHRVASNTAVP